MILFLAANPVGNAQVRPALDEECAAIERELRMTARRDEFEFRSRWAVTVDDFMRALNETQPDIIHFSGHGGATGLILVGDRGQLQPVTAAALTKMIRSSAAGARLAVLNACYSEDQADSLRDAVGCAIGMKGTISDEAARTFAIAFYRGLGYGRPVRNAYEQAEATLDGKGLTAQAQPKCLERPGVDAGTLHFGEGGARVQAGTAAAPTPDAPQPRAGSGAPQPAPPAGARPPQPTTHAPRYDLFLAHPSANKSSAGALYDLLLPDIRVFLDERSLQPGDRWDQKIAAAQRSSRATVILISSHADAAWYLGDEIVTAIALHRAAPESHRLLPVLLEPGIRMSYGLNHVQAIDMVAVGGIAGVAGRLREVVAQLRGQGWSEPVVGLAADSAPAFRSGGGCDHRRLHDRLSKVTDIIFEEIVFHAGINRSWVAPRNAPLAERVLDVGQLAGVDQDLCRRVSDELDRRAPWTKGVTTAATDLSSPGHAPQRTLPQLLATLPVSDTFPGRSQLLDGLLSTGLNRTEGNKLLDLNQIVTQLKTRRLPDGRPALVALIDNALEFAAGTEVHALLLAERIALAHRS